MRSIVLILNNSCNFRCKTCLRSHEKDEFLSFDLFKTLDLKRFDNISFTGGEACLHPQFNQFIEEVTKYNVGFGITTNGYYLDKYKHLAKHPNLKYVIISIDGTKDTHDKIRAPGSFERAIASLRFFSRHKPTRVQMCVNRLNIKEIKKVMDISFENGAQRVRIENCIQTQQNHEIVLNKKERESCRDLLRRLKVNLNVSFWENRLFRHCPMWDCLNPVISPNNEMMLCCDMEPGKPCGKIEIPMPELIDKCKSMGSELKRNHNRYLRNNSTELSMCDWCNSISLT